MSHANRPARADAQKNLPVEQLQRGRLQPRQAIDGPGLARLAESVQAQGVIQPLFVRKVAKGRFEILAGERRWQAAKMAGLRRVPTVIRNVTDATALAISLIENLHREDLNPMDQAVAIARLVDDFSQTHAQVAEMIGRSRATVTNLLRLLELPTKVRSMIADGRLDMGHGRALLTLPKDECVAMAEAIVAEGLSVREVERRVSGRKHIRRNSGEAETTAEAAGVDESPGTALSSTSVYGDCNYNWLSDGVRRRLGDSSSLKRHRDGRWHLDVSFGNLEELREALASIEGLLEQPETKRFALTSG